MDRVNRLLVKHARDRASHLRVHLRAGAVIGFGFHARQAGGVCGVEMALWDIVGKYYGVPVWQLLGGKVREKIRVYCDTDLPAEHRSAART